MGVVPLSSARTIGISCLIGAGALLTASDSIIKWLSPTYALHEIMVIRAAVGLLATLVFIQLEGGLQILRTHRPGLHLLRGLLLVVANMCFFLGLATLPLAEAVALFFIAPLLITALSVPVLGERVGVVRWAAIGAGLLGVIVILRPGSGMASLAGGLPLIAALAYACLQLVTRRIGVADKASTLAFYLQVTFLAVSAGIGLAIGDGRFAVDTNPTLDFLLRAWSWPSHSDWLLLILCGLLVACGSYLLSQAYRITEAAAVAPFEYAALPFAVFWGYKLWGDLPDTGTVLGSLIIVGSGMIVFFRETRAAKAAAQPT